MAKTGKATVSITPTEEDQLFNEEDVSIDKFMVFLASHATPSRFKPFPDEFRFVSQPGSEHTDEEYARFRDALTSGSADALKYVTQNINIVRHNSTKCMYEFEFKYDDLIEYQRNLKHKSRWYLYHGSPMGNWYSIIRNGLKNMSKTQYMTTGAVYGDGIYLSNAMSVSRSYCGVGKYACMAVMELLVDPEPYKKGEGIYVIPDEKLMFPRYLYFIHGSVYPEINEVLAFYKKTKDAMLKPVIKRKRLDADIAEISSHIVEFITDDKQYLLVKINGLLYRCYLYQYPLSPPVFQLVNQLADPDITSKIDSNGVFKFRTENWTASMKIADIIELITRLKLDSVVDVVNQPLDV